MIISPAAASHRDEQVMYRYLPQPGGNWKMVDNAIVERDPNGVLRVRFKP